MPLSVAAVMAATALAVPSAHQHPTPDYRHDGCNSHRCDRRMDRKAHEVTRHRWWRQTIPYRGWLASTRSCESGGRYWINTGNGFYGAYQFTLGSWHGVGGRGYPHQAEPLEQDYRAVRLLHVQGRGAWPVCG